MDQTKTPVEPKVQVAAVQESLKPVNNNWQSVQQQAH